MIDFAGRTAFVTGGANGVGIGLVRALLAEGCKVAIGDIRHDSIDKALATLDSNEVMGVQVDVSSRDAMAEAADKVEAQFGTVTLLFNNAGVNLFQTIEDSSYSDWDWLMGVNLHGPINDVMTFVPRMIAKGKGGYIVNTASMADRKEKLAEHFQDVLGDDRDYLKDPGYDERIETEAMRRAAYKAAREAARTAI